MTTGELIRKARKEKGLTQSELANKMGISYVVISQYERGIRNPKLETLCRIADALDVDVKTLIPEPSGSCPAVSLKLIPRVRADFFIKTAPFAEKCKEFHRIFDEELNDDGKKRIMEYVSDLIANEKYLKPESIRDSDS